MYRKYLVAMLVPLLFMTGCAHQIAVAPDNSSIYKSSQESKHKKYNVGYFISPKKVNLQVVTPGGGGDSVKYYPYRDIEAGYRAMLLKVFNSAVKLETENENMAGIDFVVIPRVVTDSSSSNLLTWPPSSFTVDLTSQVKNKEGAVVAEPHVVGRGEASYKEYINDFGISGRRAMEDALVQMLQALSNARLPSL